jgi:hypothetical protein
MQNYPATVEPEKASPKGNNRGTVICRPRSGFVTHEHRLTFHDEFYGSLNIPGNKKIINY